MASQHKTQYQTDVMQVEQKISKLREEWLINNSGVGVELNFFYGTYYPGNEDLSKMIKLSPCEICGKTIRRNVL